MRAKLNIKVSEKKPKLNFVFSIRHYFFTYLKDDTMFYNKT